MPDPEREPAPHERAERAAPLDRAGHAVRAREQEEAEQEVALSHAPGAAAQVIEREQERARRGGPGAERPRIRPQERAGRGEPAQIEEPPGEIAASQEPDARPQWIR